MSWVCNSSLHGGGEPSASDLLNETLVLGDLQAEHPLLTNRFLGMNFTVFTRYVTFESIYPLI